MTTPPRREYRPPDDSCHDMPVDDDDFYWEYLRSLGVQLAPVFTPEGQPGGDATVGGTSLTEIAFAEVDVPGYYREGRWVRPYTRKWDRVPKTLDHLKYKPDSEFKAASAYEWSSDDNFGLLPSLDPDLTARIRSASHEELNNILIEHGVQPQAQATPTDLYYGDVRVHREYSESLLRNLTQASSMRVKSWETAFVPLPKTTLAFHNFIVGEDGATKSVIALNTYWTKHPDETAHVLAVDAKRGFHPNGSDTVASLVTHEFGHAIDYHTGSKMSLWAADKFFVGQMHGQFLREELGIKDNWGSTNSSQRELSDSARITLGGLVGEYSVTSPREAVAELYAYTMSNEPRDDDNEILKEFRSMLSEVLAPGSILPDSTRSGLNTDAVLHRGMIGSLIDRPKTNVSNPPNNDLAAASDYANKTIKTSRSDTKAPVFVSTDSGDADIVRQLATTLSELQNAYPVRQPEIFDFAKNWQIPHEFGSTTSDGTKMRLSHDTETYDRLAIGAQRGFNVAGTPEYAATHEYAHVIDFNTGKSMSGWVGEQIQSKQISLNQLGKEISEYAATNVWEATAEIFAASRLWPEEKKTPFIKAFEAQLDSIMERQAKR